MFLTQSISATDNLVSSLTSNCRKRVVFLDTDYVPAPEVKVAGAIANDVEALLVFQVTLLLKF